MDHEQSGGVRGTEIEARLERVQESLREARARASEPDTPGLVATQPGLEAVGDALEDLEVAAQELAATARRMRDEQLRYEQLFQLAPYVVTNSLAVIEHANHAAAALLERDPRSVVGTSLTDYAGPDQRHRLSALHDAAAAEPGRIVEDDVTVRIDDHSVPLSVRCRAVRDADDRVAAFGWVLENLTGGSEAERRARAEQEAESTRLRSLVQHWQRLESAKSHFLNLASHELRTPVTVLAGYLSMLDEGNFGELPPTVERVISLLVAKTGELNDLINDMLETARLDDDRVDLHMTEVDVMAMVGQLVDDWRPLAHAGQALTLEAPGGPALIEADAARLRIIVSNLLSNAVKYSPGGGDIVCAVDADDTSITIAIRDRGLGIAAADMDVLFTRFGRVVTPATNSLPGTGLGLYIARELAELHGGDITVLSSPGQGSEFAVVLPRQRHPSAAPPAAAPTVRAVSDVAGR